MVTGEIKPDSYYDDLMKEDFVKSKQDWFRSMFYCPNCISDLNDARQCDYHKKMIDEIKERESVAECLWEEREAKRRE